MNKKERIEQAFPGIYKAIADYNGWNGHAVIMIDVSDCNMWTDLFVSDVEYKRYHSPSIFKLIKKDGLFWCDDKTSAGVALWEMSEDLSSYGAWKSSIDDPEIRKMAEDVAKIAKNLMKGEDKHGTVREEVKPWESL